MTTIEKRVGRLSALLLLALAGLAPVWADDDDDAAEHEAFKETTISLSTAAAAAEAQTGARAMSAEFAKDDGAFIYEVELLAADGTTLEAEVDAQTAAVLEVETEDGEDDEDDAEDEGDDGRDNDDD
jgi:uncharacterized membrane protein YkoI